MSERSGDKQQRAKPFPPDDAILWLESAARHYDEQMHFLEADAYRSIIATIQSLRSHVATSEKPVAWMRDDPHLCLTVYVEPKELAGWIPLYAAPSATAPLMREQTAVAEALIGACKNLPPEFRKVVDENFWKLLTTTDGGAK